MRQIQHLSQDDRKWLLNKNIGTLENCEEINVKSAPLDGGG